MTESVARSGLPIWDEAMSATGDHRLRRGRPDWTDIGFFIVLAVGAGFALNTYGTSMDYYEKIILISAVGLFSWMAWLWRPLRTVMIASGLTALLAIWLYSPTGVLLDGDLTR